MEDTASGNGDALLVRMKALARRGAVMRRQPDGAGVIENTVRRREERIAPAEFLGLVDSGWIRETGADQFVISRRGATALRNHLNRPQAGAVRKLSGGPFEKTREANTRDNAAPGFNNRESPLAWLRLRRDKDGRPMISAIEFEAGERLRADFERGLMGPRVTASWDGAVRSARQARTMPGTGGELSDIAMAARLRVDLALKAVGPELSGMLLDVCCFLKGLEQAERAGGWPRRAGKVVLQLALAQLARHYGLAPLDTGPRNSPARVRGWHAAADVLQPASPEAEA